MSRAATRIMLALVLACVGGSACGRVDFEARSDGGGDGGVVSTGLTTAIAAGLDFTCALHRDGSVWCWGDGAIGELGTATRASVLTPAIVPGIADAIAIGAGADNACAVRAGGGVVCWGDNSYGQLGVGDTSPRVGPIAVSGLPAAATAVSVGTNYACALLADRTAWCWGENDFGEVGSTTVAVGPNVTTPLQALDDVSALAAGSAHECAVRGDHTAWCWGQNYQGEVGNGSSGMTVQAPSMVAGVSAMGIAAGAAHTCALTTNNHYQCWGDDFSGELGDGSTTGDAFTPAAPGGDGTYVALNAAGTHTCAVRDDGGVQCWGDGTNGELGTGSAGIVATPTTAAITGPVIAVAAGGAHTCALRGDGSVACWGLGSVGQLGTGLSSVWTPTLVALPGSALDLAAGDAYTCAVIGANVHCWGDDLAGQLGDGGALQASATPIKLENVGAGNVAHVFAGGSHACATLGGGGLVCWGANDQGELGNGSAQAAAMPVTVPIAGVVTVGAGEGFTCAATASGLACWGANDNGQLGTGAGSSASVLSPAMSAPPSTTTIAAGAGHACEVTASGQLECWGADYNGECGDGTAQAITLPTTLPGAARYGAVSAGFAHTCALTTPGGALACWGDNSYGEDGDGGYDAHDTPETIGLPTTAIHLALGNAHSCVVANGVMCAGDNTYGQLGDGTSTQRPMFTAAPGVPGLISVLAAGAHHTCALVAGEVYCWGDNGRGQLGLGTFSRSLTPVDVTFP